jgi:DNA repair exonuclease SbcCD nuclease subunit
MAFRFLHLADLHLESSFGGRPETRERLRLATHEAFRSAVDYAIGNRLHAVLAAGDLFDDAVLSLKTELFFTEQVERLARAGVWFVAVCGNHDPGAARYRSARLGLEAGEQGKEDWRQRVRLLRRPEPEIVRITNRSGDPVGVVVGAGHESDREQRNLAARFPSVPGALPVVGLLHTQIAAARAAEGHERYAPSNAADYEGRDYSYWALGHIHVRQRAVPGLPVFYAGNLQGRNPKETGQKGGYRVEAEARSAAEPAFVPLAPVRWERLELTVDPEWSTPAALVENLARCIEGEKDAADERLAVRIELCGRSRLASALRKPEDCHFIAEELRERTGCLEVQLRSERLNRPVDVETLRQSPTVVAEALRLIDATGRDPELLESLAPPELAAPFATSDERRAYLEDLLVDLGEELIERSFAGEGA